MNYEIPADGVYAFSLYRPETKTRKVKVYRNDELLQTLDISARMVFCLGNLKAGDALSLRFDIAAGKGTTFRLEFAVQNDDVLDHGLELLRDEKLVLTSFSDTCIRGTIAVKQDGLLYTSIPYERGWTAYVDGAPVALASTYDPKAEDVKLTDAVIAIPLAAGMHDVEFRFTAPGLKLGALISLGGLLAFGLLLLLREEFILEEHLDALGIFDPNADYEAMSDGELSDLSAYLKGTEWEAPEQAEEEASELIDEGSGERVSDMIDEEASEQPGEKTPAEPKAPAAQIENGSEEQFPGEAEAQLEPKRPS